MRLFYKMCLLAFFAAPANAHAALSVFACVPEWAALAREIGGNRVNVFAATNAMQDPHRIEARPSLIARVRGSDLVVCTGAELEVGWLPVLLQSAGNAKVQPGTPGYFLASEHARMIEVPTSVDRSLGDIHPGGNPHLHLDPRNVSRVGEALAARFAQLDPAGAGAYQAQWKSFQERWLLASRRWETQSAPLRGIKVIPRHKDLSYLWSWIGAQEIANVEPKPGISPSAAHLSELLTKVQADPKTLLVRSAYQDAKATDWLSERGKVNVVVLPYTVGGSDRAKDLFGLFDDTVERLLKAVK